MKNLFLVLMACCFSLHANQTQSDILAESISVWRHSIQILTWIPMGPLHGQNRTVDFKVFEAKKQMDLDAFLKYSNQVKI